MTKLSQDQREALGEELKELGIAEAKIVKAREPYDQAMLAIGNARDLVLRRYGVDDPVGECETCDKILFEGDPGHQCGDGPVLCDECAPTWGDLKRQVEASAEDDDEGGIANTEKLSAANAHLAAGGKLTDPIVHPL